MTNHPNRSKREVTIYIKSYTNWAGDLLYCLGYEPSSPEAGPCTRLGSYFLVLHSLFSARAVAKSLSSRVVECQTLAAI